MKQEYDHINPTHYQNHQPVDRDMAKVKWYEDKARELRNK